MLYLADLLSAIVRAQRLLPTNLTPGFCYGGGSLPLCPSSKDLVLQDWWGWRSLWVKSFNLGLSIVWQNHKISHFKGFCFYNTFHLYLYEGKIASLESLCWMKLESKRSGFHRRKFTNVYTERLELTSNLNLTIITGNLICYLVYLMYVRILL